MQAFGGCFAIIGMAYEYAGRTSHFRSIHSKLGKVCENLVILYFDDKCEFIFRLSIICVSYYHNVEWGDQFVFKRDAHISEASLSTIFPQFDGLGYICVGDGCIILWFRKTNSLSVCNDRDCLDTENILMYNNNHVFFSCA